MTESQKPEEFVDLYSRHQAKLLRFVVALVSNLDDAEDILQETSRVLWERFDDYEPNTNFLAWARKVALMRVFEYRRSSARRAKLLPDETLERIVQQWEIDENSGLLSDRAEAIQLCVSQLRDAERQLLHQRYVVGQRVNQIAEYSLRTVNAVSKSLERIRNALYRCVKARLASNVNRLGSSRDV